MAVHLIIQTLEILDREMYTSYIKKARPIIEAYGGKYLTTSENITPLSDWMPLRIIILEFENIDVLGKCFSSEEYKAIEYLRDKSVVGKALIAE